MAGKQGRAKTGGRRKGTPNKANAAREEEIRASGITPLDYLLTVLRDADKPEQVRIDAAKAAAPYVHPKLASVEVKGDPDQPIEQRVTVIDEKAVAATVKRIESEY